jgi:hypothetical protein
MDRSQIRWKNVGRLAAGAAGAGALLVVAPGLFEPPQPPPLPADVGLATGATGVTTEVPDPEAPAADSHARERRERSDRQRGGRHESEPRPAVKGRRDPLRPRTHTAQATAPSPATPVASPAVASQAITAPAATLAPPPTAPPPAAVSPPRAAHPSEFGFER